MQVVAKFQFWDVPAFFDWWVGADNLQARPSTEFR